MLIVALLEVWFLRVARDGLRCLACLRRHNSCPRSGVKLVIWIAYVYVLAIVAAMAFAGDRLLIVASSGSWDRSCMRASSSYGYHSQFSLSGAEAWAGSRSHTVRAHSQRIDCLFRTLAGGGHCPGQRCTAKRLDQRYINQMAICLTDDGYSASDV